MSDEPRTRSFRRGQPRQRGLRELLYRMGHPEEDYGMYMYYPQGQDMNKPTGLYGQQPRFGSAVDIYGNPMAPDQMEQMRAGGQFRRPDFAENPEASGALEKLMKSAGVGPNRLFGQ